MRTWLMIRPSVNHFSIVQCYVQHWSWRCWHECCGLRNHQLMNCLAKMWTIDPQRVCVHLISTSVQIRANHMNQELERCGVALLCKEFAIAKDSHSLLTATNHHFTWVLPRNAYYCVSRAETVISSSFVWILIIVASHQHQHLDHDHDY